LHQFREKHEPRFDAILSGFELMLWGFFKKVVIADRFAVLVNRGYSDPSNASGTLLMMATYAFAIQIYCDFSGYSDIARGLARTMGFELMKNFDAPYFASSPVDFWRRWHISLSTWFRDYVYIPLGGGRRHKVRNTMVVFLLSGLWHGASWSFVLWGAWHGFWVALQSSLARFLPPHDSTNIYSKALSVLGRSVGTLLTLQIVVIGWVFFRAATLANAALILRKIATDLLHGSFALGGAVRAETGLSSSELYVGITFVSLMLFVQALARTPLGTKISTIRSLWPRAVAAYSLLAVITICGKFTAQQFIYFQF
jgi:D-alanyl-lipoteichoic acid acyltransferase DltB (MBOAT superfamily)